MMGGMKERERRNAALNQSVTLLALAILAAAISLLLLASI
jgi:hypothetical protein